jgi:hypothetical protein
MAPIYHSWLGLPHEIGADPRDGHAACCLVMARILLEDAGQTPPPIDDWIELARAGRWEPLRDAFYRNTEELPKAEPWSITLLDSPEEGLGIGTVVPGRLLLVPLHSRGVTALPLFALPADTTYHRVLGYA